MSMGKSKFRYTGLLTLATAGATLLGCAGVKTKKMGDSMLGKSETELVAAFGPPASNFQDSTGNKIYTYSSAGRDVASVQNTGFMQQGVVVQHQSCVVNF